MEVVIELYKCAWNAVDTYTPKPSNYTPLLGDRSVHSPMNYFVKCLNVSSFKEYTSFLRHVIDKHV
jgi:hypothetical protein